MGGNVNLGIEWHGREAAADEISLSKVNRSAFKGSFVTLFKEINRLYSQKFDGDHIWEPTRIELLLNAGEAFNGSSEHLFGSKIEDEKFLKHKPTVGDIDLTVPEEKLKNILDLLNDLRRKEITGDIEYVGNNKEGTNLGKTSQINALFSYYPDPNKPETFYFTQVDFEGVPYTKKGMPSAFAKFTHSSEWIDIEANVKGVFHKYLLRSIINIFSRDPGGHAVLKTGKPSTAAGADVISHQAFSADRGIRKTTTWEKTDPVDVGGKQKTGYRSLGKDVEHEYETDPDGMFEIIFGHQPNSEEKNKFRSYIGLLDLISRDRVKFDIKKIYTDLVERLMFEPASQALSRPKSNPKPEDTAEHSRELERVLPPEIFGTIDLNDPDEVERVWTAYQKDYLVKKAAIDKFISKFSGEGLEDYDLSDKTISNYIINYGGTRAKKAAPKTTKKESLLRSYISSVLSG
jgi:hypothetical protein